MKNVVLTGFMATGKSAVARALARELGWRHIDCDSEIAARAGQSIAQMFCERGEAHFRAMEHAVIAALAANPPRCEACRAALPSVIATGGGAIVSGENCALLRQLGVIVCLTARAEIIAQRVGASARSRPMLTNSAKPLPERIAELMEQRREAYARADLTVDTSGLSISEVVDAIVARLALERWEACHRCG